MVRPARFLGIAEDSGDEFTYYIRTKGKKPQILIRSNIKSYHINISTDNELVSDNSSNFTMQLDDLIDKDDAMEDLKIPLSVPTNLPPPPGHSIPSGFSNPMNDSLSDFDSIKNKEDSQHKASIIEPIDV